MNFLNTPEERAKDRWLKWEKGKLSERSMAL
jgi:hypothetical protein